MSCPSLHTRIDASEKPEPRTAGRPLAARTQKEGHDKVMPFFFKYAFQVCTQTQIATQRKRLRFGEEEQGSGRMTSFFP